MNVSAKESGNCTVVSIEGRVDTLTAPQLEERLLELIRDGDKDLILDLSKLVYLSSAGLRVFLEASKQTRKKGRQVLCCGLSGVVGKVFEVSGFASLVPVFDTVEEALKAR